MEKYEFKTKQEIADYIGISRRVLYYRADKYNINLNEPLTEQDIVRLRSENAPNEHEKKKQEALKKKLNLDTVPKKGEQDVLEMYEDRVRKLQGTIDEQKKQLEQKDVQIMAKDVQIKEASEQFAKLADQQQQLQLASNQHIEELEHKLDEQKTLLVTSEPNKGFWYNLFH